MSGKARKDDSTAPEEAVDQDAVPPEALALLQNFQPIVGREGQKVVKQLIHRGQPDNAINEVVEKCGLRDPECGVLLNLLDELNCSRGEVRGVFCGQHMCYIILSSSCLRADVGISVSCPNWRGASGPLTRACCSRKGLPLLWVPGRLR